MQYLDGAPGQPGVFLENGKKSQREITRQCVGGVQNSYLDKYPFRKGMDMFLESIEIALSKFKIASKYKSASKYESAIDNKLSDLNF